MENSSQMNSQIALPNSTAVLVLGILSIVCCVCYGVVGLVLGIIAISLSKKAKLAYSSDPQKYTNSSFSNMKAGRTCAIIGTCLSAAYMLFFVIYFAIFGSMFALFMNEAMNNGSQFNF